MQNFARGATPALSSVGFLLEHVNLLWQQAAFCSFRCDSNRLVFLLQPYVPSLLSMDEDGRVVRFDSFSKLLSGGYVNASVSCLSIFGFVVS